MNTEEQMRKTRLRLLLLTMLAAPVFAGCGLARTSETRVPPQASPGEQQGTIPASAASETVPVALAVSPRQAVERYALTYTNWTYATLEAVQARLAASAVGEARATELQAKAQTRNDRVLARAQIYNSGSIVAVAPVQHGSPGEWVVDTRERTGGTSQEYAATREGFHVTLATVRRVGQRFVVARWRPQI